MGKIFNFGASAFMLLVGVWSIMALLFIGGLVCAAIFIAVS